MMLMQRETCIYYEDGMRERAISVQQNAWPQRKQAGLLLYGMSQERKGELSSPR